MDVPMAKEVNQFFFFRHFAFVHYTRKPLKIWRIPLFWGTKGANFQNPFLRPHGFVLNGPLINAECMKRETPHRNWHGVWLLRGRGLTPSHIREEEVVVCSNNLWQWIGNFTTGSPTTSNYLTLFFKLYGLFVTELLYDMNQ